MIIATIDRDFLALFVQCAGSNYCWHKYIWQIRGLLKKATKGHI